MGESLDFGVTIEVNKHVDPELVLKCLNAFVESSEYSPEKRINKSASVSQFDRTVTKKSQMFTHRIECRDLDIKQRILEKKFFSFENFLLRASQSGYQSDTYAEDNLNLIICNIDDEDTVYSYAQYLSSNNEIGITPYSDSAYLITYAKAISKKEIELQYAKRPSLHGKKIKLVHCFQTNTIIVRLFETKPMLFSESKPIDFLKEKVIQRIDRLNIRAEYFYDIVQADCALFQFESNEYGTDCVAKLIDSFKCDNSLLVEMCYNFSLLNTVPDKNDEPDFEIIRVPICLAEKNENSVGEESTFYNNTGYASKLICNSLNI